jgi:hypothetical protein
MVSDDIVVWLWGDFHISPDVAVTIALVDMLTHTD